MFSRRQWLMLTGAIVAVFGITKVVEAQETLKDEDKCKDVGENNINLTESAKIRKDNYAVIDGPWCGRNNPWRVRYSNAKLGAGIQSFPTLDSAKRAVEEFDPSKKFRMK